MQLWVAHIPDIQNTVANALSHFNNDAALVLIPQLQIFSFEPPQDAWTIEQLCYEWSVALSFALNQSSKLSYTSALNSYIKFCKMHSFPIEPVFLVVVVCCSLSLVSFYVMYMPAHIKPHGLESYFPEVQQVQKIQLVLRTLCGCKWHYSQPVSCAQPISLADMQVIYDTLHLSNGHNDKLFLTLLFTGFHALMSLGELVSLDNPALRDFWKMSPWNTVAIDGSDYCFTLPTHKTNLFKSNVILVQSSNNEPNPVQIFNLPTSYHPQLWLQDDGSVPLQHFFPKMTGHALCCSGATLLTMNGVSPENIHHMGRWSSSAWEAYVHKHPILLQAFIFSGHGT
ncbi:hypothetical protein NEOLEDRAFT_1156171 [Neolentinus lepideus HHB14362 ss-1]|uniref:Uncharacterized protein n=1 Tax=Neolentinus lepideus HHB14362 ss-1 TaxID=1314782 RepID=A0A165SWF0_9AGAM|nr:hypothetical protein NEOLEDRAFT_1156171 [Neolentinus lepideus HHB14362 ss-1]